MSMPERQVLRARCDSTRWTPAMSSERDAGWTRHRVGKLPLGIYHVCSLQHAKAVEHCCH